MAEKKVVTKDCSNFFAEHESCPGRQDIPNLIESYDDSGVYTVIESGSFNIQDKINLFKDDVEIYNILRRVGDGERDLLDRSKGSYLDITALPTNLHEAHAAMRNAQEFFQTLPVDVRKQYNNNFRQFIADYGSDQFFSIFQRSDPAPTSDTAPAPSPDLTPDN